MRTFDNNITGAAAEAAAWISRLRADDRTQADEENFHRWLKADARNAEAFEEMNRIWDDAGFLNREVKSARPFPQFHFSRRKLFAGIGAVAGLGTFAAIFATAQAKTYQTAIGEQKHVVLNDGTSVLLDTDTKLVARFNGTERSVEVRYGRANFRVAPDSRLPFTVMADREAITGTNSTFDVSRDHDRVSVVLIHGNAVVESNGGGGQSRQHLSDGQQLLVTGQRTVKLDKPYLLQLLAWQVGQAMFEKDSLSQAIYEMNRYSILKLRIADERIANMRVSGVYRVGDNVLFAIALSKLLPIKLQSVDNGIELRGDDSRMTQG